MFLAVNATSIGALVGLALGVAASSYVGVVDLRERRAGRRTRAEYRGSLVVVPAILAGLGALAGMLAGNLT